MNCASQQRKTQPALSFAINNNRKTAKTSPGAKHRPLRHEHPLFRPDQY